MSIAPIAGIPRASLRAFFCGVNAMAASDQRRLSSVLVASRQQMGSQWQEAVTGGGFEGTVAIDGVDAVEEGGSRYQRSQNGAAAGEEVGEQCGLSPM
jgi:hypothetical protein